MNEEDRYQSKFRIRTFKGNDPIPVDPCDPDSLGTWDNVEKCWVKHDASGEWVPEND